MPHRCDNLLEMIPDFKKLVGGAELKLVLNTGRSIDQGKTRHDKFTKEYKDATDVAFFNKKDMEEANLVGGEVVSLSTYGGKVNVIAKESKYVDGGMVFVPLGPYANALVPMETKDGSPYYKSLDVSAVRSMGKPTELEELFA